MSSQTPKPDEREERGRQSDLALMSVEEYKQKSRLETILEAIEKVEETNQDAMEDYLEGRISEDGRNIAVLSAVQRAIRECWVLIRRHAEEEEEYKYLTDEPLGTLTFAHEEDEIVFAGLYSLLEAKEVYVERWREEIPWRHGDNKIKHHKDRHTVPRKVSWRGFLLLREFLEEETNIVLDVEEEDPDEATADYSDILNGDSP